MSRFLISLFVVCFVVIGLGEPVHGQWTEPDTNGNTSYTGDGDVRLPNGSFLQGIRRGGGVGNLIGFPPDSRRIVVGTNSTIPRELRLYTPTDPGQGVSIHDGNDTVAFFQNDGNVGIGTASPAERLDVNGNVILGNESSRWRLVNNADGSIGIKEQGFNGAINVQPDGSANVGLVQLTEGKVGIGMAASSHMLEVAGGVIGRNPANSPSGSTVSFSSPAGDPGVVLKRGDGHGSVTRRWDVAVRQSDAFEIYDNTAASSRLRIDATGKIGIGTTSPSEKLTVNGNVLAKEVIVDPDQIPDYVFEEDYDLPTLAEVSSFIDREGHLPSVPSVEEVKKNGLRLGEMDATLLRKVEELTLYAIEQKQRADRHAARSDTLASQLERVRRQLDAERKARRRQQRQIDALRRQVRTLIDQRRDTTQTL